MKVRINIILIYLLFGLTQAILPELKAQSLLNWEKLSDVNFDLVWFEEHQSKFMVPRFGPIPNSYKNKKVKIKGYVIPVDAAKNLYVISKVPMAMCFFCGGSGSETIVELEMKKGFSKRYNTDDVKTFQGVLTLNTKDVMHFIYILKDAVEVSTP
jgi:hypothetical protein